MSIRIIQAGETPEPVAPVAIPSPVDPASADAVIAPTPTPAPIPDAPTPSETIVRMAPGGKTATILLPSGRNVTVRRLGALDRMMAAKAIGSELVTNALYANYALVACSITAIDAVVVSMPSSSMQIEMIIQRIGDDFDDLTELMRVAFGAPEVSPFDGDAVKN